LTSNYRKNLLKTSDKKQKIKTQILTTLYYINIRTNLTTTRKIITQVLKIDIDIILNIIKDREINYVQKIALQYAFAITHT